MHCRHCCCTCRLAAAQRRAQSPLERGGYLVNGILTCGNCHTPRGPGGVFDMARQLSGGRRLRRARLQGERLQHHARQGNRHRQLERRRHQEARSVTACGRTARRWRRSCRSASTRSSRRRDLDAIVAYLRSVPPVSNKVPSRRSTRRAMHVEIPPGAEKPLTDADMSDQVKRGFYLVTIGHCMECHTPTREPASTSTNSLGKGGQRIQGPVGRVGRRATSPRTRRRASAPGPTPRSRRAITQGMRKDGSRSSRRWAIGSMPR